MLFGASVNVALMSEHHLHQTMIIWHFVRMIIIRIVCYDELHESYTSCPGACTDSLMVYSIMIIMILSFEIAPFPYKHAQRRITFHCQRIDVDIHIVNRYIHP